MFRFSLIFTACAMAAAADRVDLRVTRVAVFSSGVAYFECEAGVRDNASAELSFRTAQINDILKSLIVQDLSGGSVGVVSYASQDPIEKTLKSFGVDLTAKPTLGQLLDQLRGEPVEICGARSVKGVIVGVETHKIVVDKGITEYDVLNVLTDAGIQQLRVSELAGVKLTNDKVDTELRKALSTLATSHDADKRTITLNFSGQGERKVRIAYLLEAPIWKTTYRLALDESGKPFLQGWATVENATEEDWRDVRLSLVSGRPISFTMDLYTPIYIPRPREELELYASLRPPSYAGAIEDKAEKAPGRGRRADQLRMATRDRNAAAEAPEMESLAKAAMPAAAPAPATLRDSGVESVAAAQQAGELFEYAIKTPVSVGRQHSAMLPIVNQEIVGEKVSIYNPVTHVRHPLHGLRMTNTTGLNLMQGPVTIFDGQVYAGDAKLPDLKPDEQRLLAYALDLGVEVTVEAASHPEQISSMRIAKGTLIYKHKVVDERNYAIKNKDHKDRALLLEQAHSDDWKLVEPKEAFEKSAGLSRFRVAAPAGKTTSHKVVFEQVLEQAVTIAPLNIDQIRIYLSAKSISPQVKAALERVIQLKIELDDIARQRVEREKESNEAIAEQARIRENLKTLQSGSDQHRRQEQKFGEVDQRIDALRAQIAEARATEEQKRKALETYVLALDIE
jgi:hypothetical protein